MNNTLKLIVSIIIAELAGSIGTLFTSPSIPTWYASLNRPDLAPPNWVFGPVWTTLFALMGIAAYIVWNHRDSKYFHMAFGFYIFQFILNIAWSGIFFGAHSLSGALIEICILWLAILATLISFGRISKAAAWLLVPYIAWVSFATYLTYMFWKLN